MGSSFRCYYFCVWDYCRFGICLPHPKTTTCHHQPSVTTHAFAWHSQHKRSIQYVSTIYMLGYPGVMVEFGRTFFFSMPYKKCAKITSVSPGSLADMLYLGVVCLFCAVSTRKRHELSLSQWWQVVVFGLWQTNSEMEISKAPVCTSSNSQVTCIVVNITPAQVQRVTMSHGTGVDSTS